MAITIVKYTDLINWSLVNVLEITLTYNPSYELLMLSDLLSLEEEKCPLDDNTYYQQVTLKSNGNGIEKRKNGYKKGIEIRTRNQYYLRFGQLVFSKIDARNGAFAIVGDDLDGAIVTKDFPTYRINEQRIRADFLLLLLLSEPFLQLVGHCSKGTTKRQRVDTEMLLKQQIPVPSFDDQDMILYHYNKILGDWRGRMEKAQQKEDEKEQYINETLGLKEHPEQKDNIEPAKLVFVKYDEQPNWNVNNIVKDDHTKSDKYPTYKLSELHDDFILIKKGFNPRYEESSPTQILNQKCVRWNYIDLQYTKGVESDWASGINEEYATIEGDILVNSTGEGTIGRSAVVNSLVKGMLYDSHILLLRVNPRRLNPSYLSLLINSKYGQRQIANIKSAKTTKQTELGLYNISKMMIPLPPIEDQKALVSRIQDINSEIVKFKDVETVRSQAKVFFEGKVYRL